eukprot:1157661-Pelagomonas_calceolata.AAC.5
MDDTVSYNSNVTAISSRCEHFTTCQNGITGMDGTIQHVTGQQNDLPWSACACFSRLGRDLTFQHSFCKGGCSAKSRDSCFA